MMITQLLTDVLVSAGVLLMTLLATVPLWLRGGAEAAGSSCR